MSHYIGTKKSDPAYNTMYLTCSCKRSFGNYWTGGLTYRLIIKPDKYVGDNILIQDSVTRKTHRFYSLESFLFVFDF